MHPHDTLFNQLKATCATDWKYYIQHEFVCRLGAGTLPEASFRRYLIQDYLFLIQFARAYALAVYKSDSLPEMRHAAAGLSAILDIEMGLHVEFSAAWGLSERDLETAQESTACMAYTSFVLERGMAGDLLDLHVALAPCIIGYAEIGVLLSSGLGAKRRGNPYMRWIEMYSGEEYQELAKAERLFLDELMLKRGGPGRLRLLSDTFARATRLEIDFWQMALELK